MRAESPFSCCLIGQQSLLVLCGEDLLARGHVIRGVATESDEIRKWASGRGLPLLTSTNERLARLLSDEACDYLFSIINYRVLPEHILRLPNRGAVNFHDGPLPGYAGMYVTTWALINGEREHGISWHWMTKEIDAGGVLKEKRFPISSDETAFTLNTKCYEAGFDAFRELVTDLEQGTPRSRPQSGGAKGGYYGLRKRPERMATLDWSWPAEELDALVRGVDFGRYENPIGCPKVIWGDRVLIPNRLTVLEQESTEPPGTLERRADPNVVAVHTATKLVEVAGLSTLDGEPVELSSLPCSPSNANGSHRLDGEAPAELDRLLERLCVHESFWAARLASREAATLPYVPADVRRDQFPAEHIRRAVDGGALCEGDDSSRFVARGLAAISLYLGRLSGKEAFDVDFQGSSLGAGPPRELALYFATSVPLRFRLNWPGSFAEHVQHAEKGLAEVLKRGTYARDLVSRSPAITEEHRRKLREVPDVAVAVGPKSPADRCDLPKAELAFLISDSAPKIELVANAAVFDERLLAKIADELAHVIAQVSASPHVALADVAVVSPAEQALLDRWNDETRVDYERLSVPRMFEAQVEQTPEATALVFRETGVSYRQLNDRANQLANLLIECGVKRGDRVGVLMDRSIEMVVSLYAVLKTGAAYVPMDPAYPSHRLAVMIEDARPTVVLTQSNRAEDLAALNAHVVVVDPADALADFSVDAPSVAIEPNDAAYVMYTSGSTGRPKGVMVTHGNIQNFFLTLDRQFAGEKRVTWLAMTSISFDISVAELLWTLTRGAQVVLRGSAKTDQPAAETDPGQIAFSLFFRKVVRGEEGAAGDQARLVREASRFARQHGFAIRPAGHADETEDCPAANQPSLSSCVKADEHPEAFHCAAEIRANVLTRLLGQPIETLAKNIALYRKTWKESGHSGKGRVTLLVPTLVCPDDRVIKAAIRAPMKEYLKKERSLVRQAAWEFPPFKKASEEEGRTLDQFLGTLSEMGLNDLVEFTFEQYYATCGLFGTRSHCLAIIERLKKIGVDEIACLIDFGSLDLGLTTEQILQHLPELNALKQAANAERGEDDPDDIAALIEGHGLTHLSCTPSRAASLTWDPRTRRAMRNLDVMIVGGEALSEELARQLQSIVPGRVFNVYGPTETTVWSTMHELTTISGPVPLGRPIANTQLTVVDERQRPLPVGVPGELLIAGDGVGRGYLNRPELTEARFLKTAHGTAYRTGDLVRVRADGVVEFLGRLDDQVKIRGHRIELGEIEAVLESNPSVRKAVVHPQDDAAGSKRLVAYVVPRSSNGFCVESLHEFATNRLPEFMVPSLFEPLTELPLTPSGKVDRRALPKPNFGQRRDRADTKRTPPCSDTERRLVELWQTLLEMTQIDRSDNFFELGGHSLLGMRAISKIQEAFGVRLSTKTFLVSSLAQVAAEIDRLNAERQTEVHDDAQPKGAAGGLKRFPRWLMDRMSGERPKTAKYRG